MFKLGILIAGLMLTHVVLEAQLFEEARSRLPFETIHDCSFATAE